MGPNDFILIEIPRFRPGIVIDSIISTLEEKRRNIDNIIRNDMEECFKCYIDWFSDLEQNLRSKFFESTLIDLILDANYRQVLTSFPGQSEVIRNNLIYDDIGRKKMLVDDIVSEFKQIKNMLQGNLSNPDQGPDSKPIIVDTNLLMHFHPINDEESLKQ